MQANFVSQREFIESYAQGKRNFSNASMQFFDISNLKLADVVFKGCKLLFCTFRNCEFKNVMFENCTVYFGSFYTGVANNLVFEKSTIELTLFDTFQFSAAEMKNCSIRWCGIFNSNSAAVDFSTSSHYNLITDISQLSHLTPQQIEEVTNELIGAVGRLDIGLKMKLKEMIQQDMKRYNLDSPAHRTGAAYGENNVNREDENLSYGEVRKLVEMTFGAYGTKTVYKTNKTEYETKDIYKR